MPRRYESQRRAEAAHETRERILGSVAAELATAAEEVRMDHIAQRAGVSLRTLYQHFRDRPGLMAAASTWLDEQTRVNDQVMTTLDELERQASERVAAYVRAPALFRAQQALGQRGKRKRAVTHDRRLREAVAAVAPDNADGARSAAAVIGAVTSVELAVALADRGLDDAELARSMRWLTRILVAAVRKGTLP